MFTVFGLMAPCLAALGLARFAKSRIAARLLISGGLYFLIVLFLSVLFGNQCIGGSLNGFTECTPSFLTPVAQTLAGPLLISFLGYLFVGPAILTVAAIFEFLNRRAQVQ
ncbi:hypothetical protein [Ascidiaceihabitans sp.]|uniref:hypothetical protein n=1 Tax=Ascidiaceihabitans sp. TaxID=1872644 RepID=UPI0032994459